MSGSSVAAEDYLKLIKELTDYQGYASLMQISHQLGVARQTVYDEMEIMIQRNLVKRINKGQYVLTKAGIVESNRFLRKHMVAEILLWKGLKLRWSELDSEAMGIEHGMTEGIIEKVCEIHGCRTCPHGNLIPGPDGSVQETDDFKLEPKTKYDKIVVSRVVYETPEILKFMENNNLFPGNTVIVDEDGRIRNIRGINYAEAPEGFFNAVKFTY